MTTSFSGAGSAEPVSTGFTVSERTAYLRAETALFMRDHVLSLVSHDLRGPLNAIHSWAYVLERKLDANNPSAQRAVAGIRNGVDQQVKLLETIVDATRAETKTLALTVAPFTLHPLLDEAAAEVRAGLARARGVEITIDSQLDSQLATRQLNGDRQRLAAAIWLMLTFGVEASSEGASVRLAARVDATAWHATVTFNATPAMLEDAASPHVLEAFARKQATEPREAKRISWVLALCKRVADAHGGSFEQGDLQGAQPVTLTLRVPLSAMSTV